MASRGTIRWFRSWFSILGPRWFPRRSPELGCAAGPTTLGFLLGWIVGPLLLLECFRTKLIHYYLPAFPACALLVTWLVRAVSTEAVNVRRWPLGRSGLALLVGIGLVATALPVTGAAMIRGGFAPPLLLVAALVAAGTLISVSWFQQGATERAVYSLAATWAVVLVACCGWLIPLTEPYRTSRIIGERLAGRSAQMGIEPVLLEYQEPGVVYALGHPIAETRDRDGFFAHLAGGRSVLTVALPSEIDVMRSHFGLVVTPVEEIDGYVLTKGKRETLEIAVVHQGDDHFVEPSSAPGAHRIGLKQTFVK